MAMANDIMLKRYMREEPEEINGEYLSSIQEYLKTYKEKYQYASSYLVSSKTNRYYHYSGQYRTMTPENPDDAWYYRLLDSDDEYSFDGGKDEYEGRMYFVDFKIYDESGNVMGVIGVGFQISGLLELVRDYNDGYETGTLLIDRNTIATMSESDITVLLKDFKYLSEPLLKSIITDTGTRYQTFWGTGPQRNCFLVTRYIPDIKAYLIVESNLTSQQNQFERQFIICGGIVAVIAFFILLIFNKMIKSYGRLASKVFASQEMEYHSLLHGVLKDMYTAVYEFDMTHLRVFGEYTADEFKRLGLSGDYREAIQAVADNFVKEEYREGFVAIASPINVLEAYNKGIREISYECLMNWNWDDYHWMRVRARLFYYNSDKSIHMIVFNQDINEEKDRESKMLRDAQSDALTGLYNKTATKDLIDAALSDAKKGTLHAFIIADIDLFKRVNDTFGHAAGDRVIKEFSDKLRRQFRDADICGRIGGDEFAVLITDIPSKEWLIGKMEKLSAALIWEVSGGRRRKDNGLSSVTVSASIGVACYPPDGEDFDTLYQNADAMLYKVKERGRNGFAIYDA
jgi:diguanylate cyclase (GGDEF)-like protein